MSLSPEATEIWEMCEKYVPIALKHLNGQIPDEPHENENTFDAIEEGLRIHFLFPGLADNALRAFARLRELRLRYSVLEKYDAETGSIKSGHNNGQIEAMFVAERDAMKPHIITLSPVQQEILGAKYMSIEE